MNNLLLQGLKIYGVHFRVNLMHCIQYVIASDKETAHTAAVRLLGERWHGDATILDITEMEQCGS